MLPNVLPIGEREYRQPNVYEPLPGAKGRLEGIPRSVLIELHECGLIRIFDVQPPGRRTPIRLVHMPTLLAFIRGNPPLIDMLIAETKREFYDKNCAPEVLTGGSK
jgi:hypothetical protein